MAKVSFKRIEDSSNLNNIPIEDGAFIVTGDGKTYIDYGEDRIATSGTPDTEMSDRSTNTVENNVIKEYVDNKVLDIYSTSEIKTNKIFVDGKPIYRKVVYTNTTTGMPSATNLNISDLDSITYIDVLLIQTRSAGGYQYKKSYYQGDNDNWRWWLNDERENNRQVMNFAGSLSSLSSTNRKCQITVEYTKTTD